MTREKGKIIKPPKNISPVRLPYLLLNFLPNQLDKVRIIKGNTAQPNNSKKSDLTVQFCQVKAMKKLLIIAANTPVAKA